MGKTKKRQTSKRQVKKPIIAKADLPMEELAVDANNSADTVEPSDGSAAGSSNGDETTGDEPKVSARASRSKATKVDAISQSGMRMTKKLAVQQYLAKHPTAGPQQVALALQARGIEISTNHVSVIKAGLKAEAAAATSPASPKSGPKSGPKLAAPKPTAPQPPKVRKHRDDEVSLSDLMAAKELVMLLGGVEQAQRAIAAWAQLAQ